ncbi:DUF6489 family protein [Thioflexithrix psekupsensis]|uniref:Uncharacterized protein n=1 Tax=Thioflexithrix psekupsensis TaxID=1570016 RepID=A0A251X5S4_9GAMM|nr:DUF6489 family protein [Thioflexithrix psekupsensis]OUD12901.1 hypothetical protein TPSD3_12220 [Thioflexithrix psekupsensis]
MKIKIDIEATPQELRNFFGLPDLTPLQDEMLEIIRRNMSAGVEGFDPATLMKPFLPEHLQALSTLQKTIWQAMMGQSGSKKESDEKDSHHQ